MKMKRQGRVGLMPDIIETQQQLNNRIAERRDIPGFGADMKRLKQSLAMGMPLEQARENCGFNDDLYFRDLVTVISRQMVDPESVLLEWTIKQQTRYMQALEIYQMAKEKNRLSQMAKAVMMMHRMDLDDIELKRLLGLIRPVTDPGSMGSGISTEDIQLAEAKWRDNIEQRVRDKLEAERRAKAPQPIEFLDGNETQRPPDNVGQATVDVHPTSGHQQGNNIQEVVPNGRVDVLHNMGTVAVQDEANPAGTDLLAANQNRR